MEYVILIVAVVIFFLLIDFRGFTKRNLKNIRMDIFKIQKEISLLKENSIQQLKEQADAVKGEQPGEADEKSLVEDEEKEPKTDAVEETMPPEIPLVAEEKKEEEPETIEVAASVAADVNESKEVFATPPPVPTPPTPSIANVEETTSKIKEEAPKEKKKTFFEKYPDLEKFIGENLINKIGIVILVLGLGFLVKYAIDQNWINEIGRVVLGVLSASLLIGLAHRLRKNYKSFSSVLIGGGLALLYFTISLAFHTEGYPLYQKQEIAFSILTLITIFAVFLSIVYNRVEIAVFAMLGGFASPLMVSNGGGNYVVLFTYLMILNIGMLVLSYFKKWRLINILSFAFTILLFGSWFASEVGADSYESFNGAIYFAAAFYILFFLMNIIYNVKHKIDFKVDDVILVLINTFAHFGLIMGMLAYIADGIYQGLFTILMALFNFVFAFYIYRTQKEAKGLLFLLIGLVLTFVTLAIPIQLEGNHITLFWAVEVALLLWLSQKSGYKVLKIGSAVVLGLMLISILMDWEGAYKTYGHASVDYVKEYAIIFNEMFITTLVAVGSLMAASILLRKDKEDQEWLVQLNSVFKVVITLITILVLYIGGILEVNYQAFHYFVEESSQNLVTVAYNAFFILSLLIFAIVRKHKVMTYIVGALIPVFMFIFFIMLSSVYANSMEEVMNNNEPYKVALLTIRWLSIIAVYTICVLMFKLINNIYEFTKVNFKAFGTILAIFAVVYMLSSGLDSMAVLISQDLSITKQTHKTGYAVIWGVTSFILMIVGMRKKNKLLRIMSLILFGITMIKLFAYDISEISEGGKIVAFILLGVLLLIISFMYQRLKRLVIDDAPQADVEKEKATIE